MFIHSQTLFRCSLCWAPSSYFCITECLLWAFSKRKPNRTIFLWLIQLGEGKAKDTDVHTGLTPSAWQMSHELCCSPGALTPNLTREGCRRTVPLFPTTCCLVKASGTEETWRGAASDRFLPKERFSVRAQAKVLPWFLTDVKCNFYFQILSVLTATLGKPRAECVVSLS